MGRAGSRFLERARARHLDRAELPRRRRCFGECAPRGLRRRSWKPRSLARQQLRRRVSSRPSEPSKRPHRVTTYVGRWDDLRERFPEANVVEEHVVVDGNLVSSVGGVTSYDAALTLLGEITNQTLTDAVAEALYYFPWLHRKTSQNSE